MRPIDKVLDAVRITCGGHKKIAGWYRCAHPCSPAGDTARSFAFTDTPDGTVMVRSHKVSYTSEDALKALGLEWRDLFPERDIRDLGTHKGSPIVYGYEYVGERGEPIGRVSRTTSKDFAQGHYERGEYRSGLNGHQLPLYLLPMVRQAIAENKTIYLVEGEKDARALCRAGVVATTKAGGASSGWKDYQIQSLKGADVVFVADRDEAGEKYARATVQALRKAVSSIKVVQSKDGKDAFDHLQAGFSVNDFVPRPDLEFGEPLKNLVVFGDEFVPVIPSYLWEPYLRVGKHILLDADGGTGKTSIMLAIAAGFSQGQLPCAGGKCEPIRTLYLGHREDMEAELETVYRANGGKAGYIMYYQEPSVMTHELLAEIEATIRLCEIRLVVIDPLSYFLGQIDAYRATEVLPICAALGHLAMDTSSVIVAIRHVGKGGEDRKAAHLGLGSVQFHNSFRGHLVARYHPDQQEHPGLVIVTDEKGSILSPRGAPFALRRIGLEVQYVPGDWSGVFKRTGPMPVRLEDASSWLVGLLSGKDWMRLGDIRKLAEDKGFDNKLLYRAKDSLGLRVMEANDGLGKLWSLDPFA